MEKKLYEEMKNNLTLLAEEIDLSAKHIILFGHCNASLELIDLLSSRGLQAAAILDNSGAKQGIIYKKVEVFYPERIKAYTGNNSIVLITSRFYAAMLKQLRELGYTGPVHKIINYNTYAEYSLSVDTIAKMTDREQGGELLLQALRKRYPGYFKVFCPFNALGDIYMMISYWPVFAKKRNIGKVVFSVPAKVLIDVIQMFGDYYVEVYEQKELDAMIQAVLYTHDENSYIPHQDRPYVVNLFRALYVKKIPLEQIYCCGVYGLPKGTRPAPPSRERLTIYNDIESIQEGHAVIFSPYAKSVTKIESQIWKQAVAYYTSEGYTCYTNVVGDEQPLDGTVAISPTIREMISVVERAGVFVGIRSGICDVLREARAKKIALYPDYNYCDTQWKAIEIYWIDQFDYNLLATEEIKWEIL
ncbi:MAG: hypothetical protein Q4D07_06345 [Selenomonadaceae bacterium]|nr:hypothetical protein [Selenomonadaceae bacterium]